MFHVFCLLVRKVLRNLPQWLLPKSKSYFFPVQFSLSFLIKQNIACLEFLFDTEHAVRSQWAIYSIITKFGGISILNKWHLLGLSQLKLWWFYRNFNDSLKSLGTLPILFVLMCSGDCNIELSFKPNFLFRIPNLDHVLHEKYEMSFKTYFDEHLTHCKNELNCPQIEVWIPLKLTSGCSSIKEGFRDCNSRKYRDKT